MRILIQHSDANHCANMAAALTARGDTVQTFATLVELQAIAEQSPVEGLILELDAESVAWFRRLQMLKSYLKAVFLTPRPELGNAMAQFPGVSLLPTPGTAIAARFLLSASPSEDSACKLGDFQLQDLDALGRRTHIFKAQQISINRPVALRLLNLEWEKDTAAIAAFLADTRAKAAVTHDQVGMVYQALKEGSSHFYTAENIDGKTLADFEAKNKRLSPRDFLEVVNTLASTLAHLASRQLACFTIEPRHIHIGESPQKPKIANRATSGDIPENLHAMILQRSLTQVLPLLDPDAPQFHEIKIWTESILNSDPSKISLTKLSVDANTRIEGLVIPEVIPETLKITKTKSSAKPLVFGLVAVFIILAAAFLLLVKLKESKQRSTPNLDQTVNFTGGIFEHPTKGNVTIGDFSVDKYEVTIRQYADFLQSIAATPVTSIAHPSQPKDKLDFKPLDWDVWYPIAKSAGRFNDKPLTLDCPVFQVDWWDAYAYARWKNRRLPTEEEWEFAAGGKSWKKFPWGDTWIPENANGSDKPTPIEGIFLAWSPVDLPPGDSTPEGVHGLAGGVSEWTSSHTVHPEFPDRNIPIVKGGSFALSAFESSSRVRILNRNEKKAWLGFRTASFPKNQ